MVILFEWHRTVMDQKSRSGLPMTGEDTGLGALASPLAGYLGKVQERAASLEYCPWCTSKGLTFALRSYRINLQESITLCTNPQCLFPLVSRSLDDVLASLVPVEPTVGNKRKNALALETEELIKPAPKRLRSSERDSVGPPGVTDSLTVSNGQHVATNREDEKVNGYQRDPPAAEATGQDSLKEENDAVDAFAPPTHSASAGQLSSDTLLTAGGDEPTLSPHRAALSVSEVEDDFREVKSPPEGLNGRCSLDSNQTFFTNQDICSAEIETPPPQHNEQTAGTGQKALAADITTCKDMPGSKPDTEDLSSVTITKELVPIPNQLFWRNNNNLCWLDSLLVALVNCRSLRKLKPEDEPQRSSVWRLMKEYEEICEIIQVHQQPGKDGVVRVPHHVLQKANADLQSLRMSVFNLLQTKLHCKLGQRETPVFALPLLLAMDSWAEPLFQAAFHWEIKCSECKTAVKDRVVNTLPTLTNILPDWRPLHAVHSAPCNVCRKKNQRRTMLLERVPPVFELHFVEGLPDNDVRKYSFTFEGKCYSVTTVIQYNQQLQHFVTWICNSDGSWLEYDDLKHPDCEAHEKLPVPAEEIHVVFWEVKEVKDPPACSPSSTFVDSAPSEKVNPSPGDRDLMVDELLAEALDESLLMSQLPHDTDIVMDTAVTADVDTSIGSTTLLDTFEGLTHNDIITLTLVELKNSDSEMQPENNNGQSQGLNVPNGREKPDSVPDSSSTVTGSEMAPGPAADPPGTPHSSDTEDGSSSDPTFVPGARGRPGRGRGRGTARGKTVSRQISKKAASSKVAADIPPPAALEPSKEISNKPVRAAAAQENTPPAETTQPTPPQSSADTSSLSTSENVPTAPAGLHQNVRWSFLLSRHPLHQAHRSTDQPPPTPATRVQPPAPPRSIPNPVRRQPTPGGLFPKPQLKTEESEGLPLKAAEMYNAFGSKSSSSPTPPLSSPALLKSKPFQPVAPDHQKLLMRTTAVSGTLLPMPGAKAPETPLSMKHSSRSSKVPPGLTDTEALRYKLMKKLKAKKKKLARLNDMLGHRGGASLQPDSTGLGSPNTVTSSTYDGSISDDFLSDLLSPATTASNLSPDSTDFLEMLANGQDGVEQVDCGVSAAGTASQVNEPDGENFLDDFISQAVAQRPSEMETEALSALELFV